MDMFDTYDNLPDDYIPDNTSDREIEHKETIPTKVRKIYNAKGNYVGIGWQYGETVKLQFKHDNPILDEPYDVNAAEQSENTDAEVDMTGKSLCVEIVNFRWESIHTFSNTGSNTIQCDIDKDITGRMKPGAYYCIFKVIGEGTETIISKTRIFVF